MRLSLVAISSLSLLLLPPVLGRQNSLPAVPNSPRGFEKQYQYIFKAYEEGDEQELTSRFRTFALPEGWFSDTFGPEQGPMLADRYQGLFRGFVAATTGEFRSVVVMESARIHAKVWKSETELHPAAKSAPPSLVPLPAVQHFEIRYQSGPYIDRNTDGNYQVTSIWQGHDNSWVDTFIYVAGAFRFFGGGPYPFWDPCSTNGPLPGGGLVKRVEPIYPQAAEKKHVQGSVSLDITIAKDGSVKDVRVVQGNSFLHSAAREAVLQWRYEPFMYCGEPVEKQLRISVYFAPDLK